MRTTSLLACAVAEGRLDQRREHAERSIALLQQASRGRGQLPRLVAATCDGLAALVAAIETAEQAVRPREAPLTERTARRAAVLFNAAAAADRLVVSEARRLVGVLACPSHEPSSTFEEKLLRWAAARLGSVDLPYFLPELDRAESERWIERFVATARTTAAGMAT
jgi:hypothetical protein